MNISNRKSVLHVAIVFALIFCSGVCAADDPKPNPVDKEFKAMDSNGDGKISADEHAAGAKKMFDTMDANQDGKVTAAEMDAAQEKVTGKKAGATDMSAADKIKAIDSNSDGTLSAQEHAAGSKAMFEKMDTNKDGFLSKDELAAGHAKMMGKSAK
jgi:Ca2+-binding EF-hand superfamily protein